MKETYKTLQPLNVSEVVYFLGTEEEQAEAEAKEAGRLEEVKNIFTDPRFIACEYVNEYGQRHILHHSTRPGVVFQMSYIDADGVPAMHENFISDETGNPENVGSINSAAELYRHYLRRSNRHPLTLHILTA